MPSIEKHSETNRDRTGRDYLELHEWIDKDPLTKVERHDITKIHEYGQMMLDKYGSEGLQEYLQHIHDDLLARFGHVKEDLEKSVQDTLAYFGVSARPGKALPSEYETLLADLELLSQSGVAPGDVIHCQRVCRKALEIASKINKPLNYNLIARGGLLHDLGKAKGRADDHGYLGAEIARSMGLPEEILRIMETHVKAGLTIDEAREAGIPAKDYTPETLEEKIVVYADKLVDIIFSADNVVSSEDEAEKRFIEILSTHPKLAKSQKAAQRQINNHLEIQSMIKTH
ncbi:MAG: HDIG domain-containing metalloprotein [Desulfomonilaceae bacterium]